MVIFEGNSTRNQITHEGDMNFASFSIMIINKELLSLNITMTQSYDILTY